MAITVVASSTTASATPTMPTGAAAGDLIVVFAYTGTTTTIATLPANWTNLNSTSLTTVAMRIAQRVYDGVWTMPAFTSASQTHAIALRGASATLGATGVSSGTTNVITWPALTTQATDGTSMVLRGTVDARPDVVIPTPTSHTLVRAEGTIPGYGTFSIVASSPGSATSTVTTAREWVVGQVEVRVGLPRPGRRVLQAVNRSAVT